MGADKEAVLEALRDIPQSERDTMDASDFAGPGESFPIKTQADVDAAKHLIGKAKDPAAIGIRGALYSRRLETAGRRHTR